MDTPQNTSKAQALRRIAQLKQAQAHMKATRIKFLMMKPKPRIIRCDKQTPNNTQNDQIIPDNCQVKI
jgi:hypothetical protein